MCFDVVRINSSSSNINNRCKYLQKNLEIGDVVLRSDTQTALIISNEEMNDIVKIVKSLEKTSLLTSFVSMLLGPSGPILFGNFLTGKAILTVGEGTIMTGHDF